jgi:hypothetical protein
MCLETQRQAQPSTSLTAAISKHFFNPASKNSIPLSEMWKFVRKYASNTTRHRANSRFNERQWEFICTSTLGNDSLLEFWGKSSSTSPIPASSQISLLGRSSTLTVSSYSIIVPYTKHYWHKQFCQLIILHVSSLIQISTWREIDQQNC